MRERPPKSNYNLSLIDLEEGPRLMSRVEGVEPQDVAIGMKVKAKIVREEDAYVLIFEPR